jgi:hypothetical protein
LQGKPQASILCNTLSDGSPNDKTFLSIGKLANLLDIFNEINMLHEIFFSSVFYALSMPSSKIYDKVWHN